MHYCVRAHNNARIVCVRIVCVHLSIVCVYACIVSGIPAEPVAIATDNGPLCGLLCVQRELERLRGSLLLRPSPGVCVCVCGLFCLQLGALEVNV